MGEVFFFSSFFNLQRAIFVANFSFLRLGLLYSQADLQLALQLKLVLNSNLPAEYWNGRCVRHIPSKSPFYSLLLCLYLLKEKNKKEQVSLMCILNLLDFRVFFIENFGLSSQAANVISQCCLNSVFCSFVCLFVCFLVEQAGFKFTVQLRTALNFRPSSLHFLSAGVTGAC